MVAPGAWAVARVPSLSLLATLPALYAQGQGAEDERVEPAVRCALLALAAAHLLLARLLWPAGKPAREVRPPLLRTGFKSQVASRRSSRSTAFAKLAE